MLFPLKLIRGNCFKMSVSSILLNGVMYIEGEFRFLLQMCSKKTYYISTTNSGYRGECVEYQILSGITTNELNSRYLTLFIFKIENINIGINRPEGVN